LPGLVNQQELLVITDRNAVREVETIRDKGRCSGSGIEFENPAVTAMFENIQQTRFVGAA
jgi:hypothetical protein